MINKHRCFYFFCSLCFLLFSCENNNEPTPAEAQIPQLIKTQPVENEVIPPQTSQAVFVFDHPVILADKTKIKINGNVIQQAKTTKDSLIVELNALNENTNYTLTIEKNAIKANPGKLNTEVFSLNFSTSEFPEIELSDLVVKNPTVEIVQLYNFLKENYGKKILSGAVANVSWNTNEAEWVHHHTGKYPALNTFDYIFLYASPADWINYGNTQVVEDWWNNNGVVSCMWHWNVPKSETAATNDVTFRPKDNAFPDGTTFSPTNALKEGTWENTRMKADLEKIADYLLLLKNKNIPVLWRPLHEAAGNLYATGYKGSAWFWWGRDGAEAFKGLWIYMFNYFQQRELNNLIWVWTSEINDSPFYPGNEYVDIIARDLYNQTSVHTVFNEYSALQKQYPGKIITLGECGNVAQLSDQWNAGATWSWFMPWYDYERTNDINSSAFRQTDHQYGNIDFWNNAWNDERVLSRDKIPNLKNFKISSCLN
ncbi:MAG: glycoside hydrolase family 26 protein [Candidatus Symbiothrix sp.]|jgi:mannan endo-1,4-beta-mannosidase|nr:glycoside hydrolase family 26 protein [Candidatus Symbiothrix sp.]